MMNGWGAERLEDGGGGGGERKALGGRWLLWLPVLMAAAVLYALSFNAEMHIHGPRHGRLAPLSAEMPPLPAEASLFLVDSAGCRMPALDPWDRVRQFVSKPQPIDCAAKQGPPLLDSNLTALFVVEDALPFYNASVASDLDCCYQPFFRGENNDNKVVFSQENCTRFTKDVLIEDEFVRVKCSIDDKIVYRDMHVFVPRKAGVEERCANASAQESYDATAPSVLLLGIDAVSRLNFHRQMPRTVGLLQEMGAVEMLGYNKVGDNTFPNMVPVLSGKSVEDLHDSCWPNDSTTFDDCHFAWDEFADDGFRTAFTEDAPWMGIFNYVKRGFGAPPTDYYGRTFLYAMEAAIGFAKHMNAKLCVGSRLTAQVLVNYASKFARTFISDRYFALFWGASLSHDFLNYPSLGDEMYTALLSELLQSGALEKTVLMVMSDHGIRWGDIRNTYQGRLEERLPFLFVVFPEGFRAAHPEAVANAQRNTRRLTTPFDVFPTLRDLVRPAQRLGPAKLRARAQALAADPRGPPRAVSLFLPVPPDRTCAQAGIDAHWCTCQQSRPVDKEEPIVKRSARFLVKHLNKLLASYRQCATLTLAEIKDVQLEVPREDLNKETKDPGVHDYILVVRTVPGDAVFEGKVRHTPKINNLTMAAYVSRLNLYGTQSACVSNYHMKLYCYCGS